MHRLTSGKVQAGQRSSAGEKVLLGYSAALVDLVADHVAG